MAHDFAMSERTKIIKQTRFLAPYIVVTPDQPLSVQSEPASPTGRRNLAVVGPNVVKKNKQQKSESRAYTLRRGGYGPEFLLVLFGAFDEKLHVGVCRYNKCFYQQGVIVQL